MIPTRIPDSPASTAGPPWYSLAGFGYRMAVAPIAFAAASPASEDPDTKMPGNRSASRGGVNRSLSTV